MSRFDFLDKVSIGVLAVLAAFVASHVLADDVSVSADLGYGNAACGTGEPSFGIRYDRDSDDVPAHFRLRGGPNGSCSGQGIAVDAYVAKRRPVTDNTFGYVAAGYDSRTVPFEYVRTDVNGDPFKHFHGERVESVQALVGVGYDCGNNCSIRVAYNMVDTPLAAGGSVAPVQIGITYQVADIEFNVTADDTVQTFTAAWEASDIVVSADVTYGATDLANDAPASFEGGYVLAGAPDVLYGVSVGLRF